MDNLFSDATLFKLNFIGIQHLEYLDIREIKTPEKPLTLQKGVEEQKFNSKRQKLVIYPNKKGGQRNKGKGTQPLKHVNSY